MSDIRIPVIRTIRVPNMKQRVNAALEVVGQLNDDIRTLHDDAKACPETVVRGNVTLQQDLYGALFDVCEAVDCLQDVLTSLDFVQDPGGEVPVVPVGADLFGRGNQEAW